MNRIASTKPSTLFVLIVARATKTQVHSASNLPTPNAKRMVSFESTVRTSRGINANPSMPKARYIMLRNVFSRSRVL